MQQYEPELGQAIFGNEPQEYDLGESRQYVSHKLYELSEILAEIDPSEQRHGFLGGEFGYGQEFKNDVFEMHPYWWGDCTCGQEEAPNGCLSECKTRLPNFRCGDISVSWYKYIGRGMSTNIKQSKKDWRKVFDKCFSSIIIGNYPV